jgi:DNA-binding NarL/FixJ family response regulator
MGGARRRLRVYVVEDSAILAKRVIELLRGLDVDIAGHADNASAAIDGIAEEKPDLVIVDIALRNGNGFDVLRSFGGSNGSRRPVVMVLSNYTSRPYKTAAKELGVEYYFDKSTGIFSMLRVVESMAKSIGLRNGSER